MSDKAINNKHYFDFDDMSLNEYAVGTHYQGDNEILAQGRTQGYQIGVDNGDISHITIFLSDKIYGYSKFLGSIKEGGFILSFDERTTPSEIKKRFGTPDDFWNDGVEENLQFKYGGFNLEFSWHVDRDNPIFVYFSVEPA